MPSKAQTAQFSAQILFSIAARDRCMRNLNKYRILERQQPSSKAAVLVPFCKVNDTLSLLYTSRALTSTSGPGQIAFPGGESDEDETPIKTVFRKTEEDIGLSRHQIELWGQVPGKPAMVIGIIRNLQLSDLTLNEKEIAEVFAIPLECFCDQNNQFYNQFGNGLLLPEFLVGHYRICGITGYLTHIFLSSLLIKDVYTNAWVKEKHLLV